MRRMNLMRLFLALGIVVLVAGCASKGTKKDVKVLQAQVGTITDELVRLDDSLQETRAEIQEEQTRINQLENQLTGSRARLKSLQEEESVIKGIYRTPSGFELPVLSIQQALKNAGYYRGSLDGKIGPQTRKAIRAYQQDNGLTVDGIVGRQTWSKLKVYLENVK